MLRVLDAAVHVHAALRAGVPLNGRVGVYDFELICIFADAELVLAALRRPARTARLQAFQHLVHPQT
jgi:hypothetical protein